MGDTIETAKMQLLSDSCISGLEENKKCFYARKLVVFNITLNLDFIKKYTFSQSFDHFNM